MPEPQQPPADRRLRATALHYDRSDAAPRVTATGSGYVAQRIIDVAREHGVPVRSDPALARALAALDLGKEVPDAMYRAVAEALAWAYRLDAKRTLAEQLVVGGELLSQSPTQRAVDLADAALGYAERSRRSHAT